MLSTARTIRRSLPLLLCAFAACSAVKQNASVQVSPVTKLRRARPETVEVAGRKVAVYQFGDPAGASVFFFHGWPSDASQGVLVDEEARRQHLRVLAPDRPGIGRSDPQPGRRIADWPPVVAALADHYGIRRFAVLGVSGGGPYALACGAALRGRVTGVSVASCAPPLADVADTDELGPFYRSLLRSYRRNPESMRLLFHAGTPVAGFTPGPIWWLMTRSLPAPDREAISNPAVFATVFSGVRKGWRAGHDGVYTDAALNAEPWGFQPEKIRVPVTFWHGEEDHHIRPSMARRLSERVPGAKLHIVAHEGHYSLPLRQAGRIIAEVRR